MNSSHYYYKLIASYLQNKIIYGDENNKLKITLGVPQDSVVGPTLFGM